MSHYVRSACCHAEIINRIYTDFPLGGSRWGINYSYEACDSCGMEIDGTVYECSNCGVVGCEGGKKCA